MTNSLRRRIFLLQIDPHCFYCNAELDEHNSTIDHVVPRSKGGISSGNIVLACGECNNKKGDSDPTSLNVDLDRVRKINYALQRLQRLAGKTVSPKNENKIARMRQAIETLIGDAQQNEAG